MAKKTAKIEAEWDEDLENKLEEKVEKWANGCGKNKSKGGYTPSAGGDMVYCLGIIGAAVYYISIATSFWAGVLGFLKALVWPAFVVYELLKFLAN